MKTSSARRVDFLGCPVDCVTSLELLAELNDAVRSHSAPKVIQFVNANKVAMVSRNAAIGRILRRSDYVLADGQPMLPMAAMLGLHIPERIDGIGLMRKLLLLADREHYSIYLLGSKQDVLEKCVRSIGEEFSGLRVAGFRNGYFSERELPRIISGIRGCSADFLFLGMGSPLKERLADEWKEAFGATVIQGVGGSFDVIAGMVKRAPLWMQHWGLEWLYRIIQEPRRMFWRYVKTNGSCLWVFFKALAIRWLKPSAPVLSAGGESNPDLGVIPVDDAGAEPTGMRLCDKHRDYFRETVRLDSRRPRPLTISGNRRPGHRLAILAPRFQCLTVRRSRRGGRSVSSLAHSRGR